VKIQINESEATLKLTDNISNNKSNSPLQGEQHSLM